MVDWFRLALFRGLFGLGLVAVGACSDQRLSPGKNEANVDVGVVDESPLQGDSNADDPAPKSAHELLARIQARFTGHNPKAGTGQPPETTASSPSATLTKSSGPFGERVERKFVVDQQDGLSLARAAANEAAHSNAPVLTDPPDLNAKKPEELAALVAMQSRSIRGTRVQAVFPKSGGDGLHVSVAGRSNAWLKVRPRGNTNSRRAVVDGLVVYPGMVGGADAIYVASEERVEEFLHIHGPEQAKALLFDVELGPDIASFRVDGSGAGLEALGKNGEVLLRAPMPEGVDANGQSVRGRLIAQQSATGRYSIRVELTTKEVAYPVLLDPSWAGTGSLATARFNHTATLLPSGKVLVVGGFNIGAIANAELYDPAAGTFSAAGSLVTARTYQTATLLGSGKVLVVGGSADESTYFSSAELYDPVSDTFSATGSLTTARIRHTATLLVSGNVLVAGGTNDSSYFSSAELYDPVSGTFSATGSLATARGYQTATLLASGNVLIAGGYNGSILLSADLYDPNLGTFSTTGSMAAAHSSHTATLLASGKVLIVGGSISELYDPSLGTFSATGSLAAARNGHTATLLASGKVLVTGGTNPGAMSSAELYDPTAGTFSPADSLAATRAGHTATLLPSGSVLVVAGYNASALSSTELYAPASGTFSPTGSLATARHYHTATLLASGKVLVAGGYNGTYLSSAEIYNPTSGTFSATDSLANTRYHHTATLLTSGKLLVAGGYNGTVLAGAELYDPAGNGGAGTFSATESLTTTRYHHTATLLTSGKVLITGGYNGSDLSSAELYDPTLNDFSTTGALATPRWLHTATLLGSGKVLVAAGRNQYNGFLSAELYDPALETFSATGSLATARDGHTATLLASGKVLVTGGHNGSDLSGAELYDPASGTFSATGSLTTARNYQSATLLVSGKVLVAAGGSGALTSAELYDEGFGFSDLQRPVISSVTGAPAPSGILTLSGTKLTGIGEGSSGHTSSSATNYPLLRLMRGDGEQLLFASTSDSSGTWKATSTTLQAQLPASMLPGHWWLSVVTNAVPSTGYSVFVGALGGQSCVVDEACLSDFCNAGVCCGAGTSIACDDGNTCTKNDTCGAGACAGSAITCAAASCPTATSENPADICNGVDCDVVVPQPCNVGYACVSGACRTNCTSNTHCDTANGFQCIAGDCELPQGTACTDDGTNCETGHCVEGVCCDETCGADCKSCLEAFTGENDGECLPVLADLDPKDKCDADSAACQEDGFCDGMGSCRSYAKLGTPCEDTTCSNGAVSGHVCDGFGVCEDNTVQCAPYICGTDACTSSCTVDDDCNPDAMCNDGHCEVKKSDGTPCGAGRECDDGHCVDGVCCNDVCDGQCQACAEPGDEGTCVEVSGEPRGDREACDGAGDVCGGECDGVDPIECKYAATTQECGSSCEDGSETLSYCDGLGTCEPREPDDCGAYVCGADRCETTCNDGSGDGGIIPCADGARCSEGRCIPAADVRCSDDLRGVLLANGNTTSCEHFLCDPMIGDCRERCSSAAECAPGNRCTSSGECVGNTAADAAVNSDSGCSIGSPHRSSTNSWALLALLGATSILRRRRRGAHEALYGRL